MADRSPSSDPGLLLLISLSGGPKHGHAMLLDVASFAGGRLGPGSLSGALTRLVVAGVVVALPLVGRPPPYRLTDAGLAALRGRLTGLNAAVSIGLARVGSR